MPDTYTLADIAARTPTLAVACTRCDRQGRVSVRRLLAEHGADMPLPTVLARLSADCPRRSSASWMDRCDPHFPGLPALLLVAEGTR